MRHSSAALFFAVLASFASADSTLDNERARSKLMESLRDDRQALQELSSRLEKLTVSYAGEGPPPEPRGPLRDEAGRVVERVQTRLDAFSSRDDAARAMRGLDLARRAFTTKRGVVVPEDIEGVANPMDFENSMRMGLNRLASALVREGEAEGEARRRSATARRTRWACAAAGAAAGLAAGWAYRSKSA